MRKKKREIKLGGPQSSESAKMQAFLASYFLLGHQSLQTGPLEDLSTRRMIIDFLAHKPPKKYCIV